VERMESGIPLIYKRNNKGPKTVPCSTPESTGQKYYTAFKQNVLRSIA